MAVDSLYKQLTGSELKSTSFGKPHAATYQFAENVLNRLSPTNTKRHVYAVGDNPAADIQGANNYGWTSMLVRTGVFNGGENATDFPAKVVCENVLEAVERAIANSEK